MTSDDYVAIDVNLGKGSPAPSAEAEDSESLIVTVEQAAHGNRDAKPKKQAAARTTKSGSPRR